MKPATLNSVLTHLILTACLLTLVIPGIFFFIILPQAGMSPSSSLKEIIVKFGLLGAFIYGMVPMPLPLALLWIMRLKD